MSTASVASEYLTAAHSREAATIIALFRHIDARDWCALEDVLCEDISYERPGYPMFLGRPRVLRFYRHERVLASGRHDLHRIVAADGAGACWGRFQGVQKNGMSVDIRFADVYQFSDDRIKYRTSYFFVPAV